jgi:hypothetical protein
MNAADELMAAEMAGSAALAQQHSSVAQAARQAAQLATVAQQQQQELEKQQLLMRQKSETTLQRNASHQSTPKSSSSKSKQSNQQQLRSQPQIQSSQAHVDLNLLFEQQRPIRALITDPSKAQLTIPMRLLNNEFTCAICLGIIRQCTSVQTCLHRFCAACIEKCLRFGKKECPQCRCAVASHRNLQRDSAFDALLERIYPDRDAAEALAAQHDANRINESNIRQFAASALAGAQRQLEASKDHAEAVRQQTAAQRNAERQDRREAQQAYNDSQQQYQSQQRAQRNAQQQLKKQFGPGSNNRMFNDLNIQPQDCCSLTLLPHPTLLANPMYQRQKQLMQQGAAANNPPNGDLPLHLLTHKYMRTHRSCPALLLRKHLQLKCGAGLYSNRQFRIAVLWDDLTEQAQKMFAAQRVVVGPFTYAQNDDLLNAHKTQSANDNSMQDVSQSQSAADGLPALPTTNESNDLTQTSKLNAINATATVPQQASLTDPASKLIPQFNPIADYVPLLLDTSLEYIKDIMWRHNKTQIITQQMPEAIQLPTKQITVNGLSVSHKLIRRLRLYYYVESCDPVAIQLQAQQIADQKRDNLEQLHAAKQQRLFAKLPIDQQQHVMQQLNNAALNASGAANTSSNSSESLPVPSFATTSALVSNSPPAQASKIVAAIDTAANIGQAEHQTQSLTPSQTQAGVSKSESEQQQSESIDKQHLHESEQQQHSEIYIQTNNQDQPQLATKNEIELQTHTESKSQPDTQFPSKSALKQTSASKQSNRLSAFAAKQAQMLESFKQQSKQSMHIDT